MISEGDFSIKDVDYYFKNRTDTDFSRFMKVYKALKDAAKRGKETGNGTIDTGLSISKLISLSGLRQRVVRMKLTELEEMGVADEKEGGSYKKIVHYVPSNENVPKLDDYLKRAEELGLV
jgi:DNA-binding transcriptional ArsR family regulator